MFSRKKPGGRRVSPSVYRLLLGAATVLSVDKPWDRIAFGQPKAVRSSRGSRRETAEVRR